MYDQIKSKEILLDKLWEYLGIGQIGGGREERWKVHLREILEVCLLPEAEFSKLDKNSRVKKCWESIDFNYGIDERSNILPYHCKQIESFKFLQEKE